MSLKKLIFLCCLVVLVLNSCADVLNKKQELLTFPDDFQNAKITAEYGDYSLHVPKYMKKTYELNDEASLQYMNALKEAYIIVIDESKQDFIDVYRDLETYDETISPLENYRNIQMESLRETITIDNESPAKKLKIRNVDAEYVEIDGKVEGVNFEIAYSLGFIEGKEKLYLIMAWTLGDRRTKFEDTYEQVMKSFKELY